MQDRFWFTNENGDGSAEATVMDDITVIVERSGLTTIDGPAGGSTTFDFDDAVVLAAVLEEGIRVLRERGYRERDDVLAWLADHSG
ncbi:hypothetical protein [Curtobacterium sp. VKM Ac-2922]|uniref:hypothetical protein n=1 Tax=Curtobacterium sp. VKM Ac-2922 TaxID=2929475 RepID=UPI001FB470DA|nr:hypothetical protein [Curtobacterium sp. VKM Ac-2922]MCJ1715095.1 hypothetical protein [Curtobacterium sp. VKM Ac-2922]